MPTSAGNQKPFNSGGRKFIRLLIRLLKAMSRLIVAIAAAAAAIAMAVNALHG